jgi:hypothetical protein
VIGPPLEINLKGPEEFMHLRLRQEGVLNAVGHPTLALDARERLNECKRLIRRKSEHRRRFLKMDDELSCPFETAVHGLRGVS